MTNKENNATNNEGKRRRRIIGLTILIAIVLVLILLLRQCGASQEEPKEDPTKSEKVKDKTDSSSKKDAEEEPEDKTLLDELQEQLGITPADPGSTGEESSIKTGNSSDSKPSASSNKKPSISLNNNSSSSSNNKPSASTNNNSSSKPSTNKGESSSNKPSASTSNNSSSKPSTNTGESSSNKPSSSGDTPAATKTKVTVKIKSFSIAYGEKLPALDFDVEGSNVSKSQLKSDIQLSLEGGVTPGSHKITGKCTSPNKWDVTFINGTGIITNRPLTLRAESKSSVYGTSQVPLTYTIVSGSVVNGDNLNITLKKADGTNAGQYPITISASHPYYDIKTENGVYTIQPATIEFEFDTMESYTGSKIKTPTYRIKSGNASPSDEGSLFTVKTDANNRAVGDYRTYAESLSSNYRCVGSGIYKVVKRDTSSPGDNGDSGPHSPDGGGPKD